MQPYDEAFFQEQISDSYRSAREVVPVVLEMVRPRSVIDVGCGVGAWLAAFRENGVEEVVGVDGDYVRQDMLMIPRESFVPHDLQRPYAAGRTFDMAVSLEVAEHLPPSVGEAFVKSLTALAPLVLFSAAVPGQGGVSHVNEQWQDYWARLFEAEGFTAIDCVRPRIWDNARVRWWYAQNTILYARSPEEHPALQRELAAGRSMPMRVVHPSMYAGLCYFTDPRTMPLGTAWSNLRSKLSHAVGRRLKRLAKPAGGGPAAASGLPG
jgi:SAM-dependent methyltransferase